MDMMGYLSPFFVVGVISNKPLFLLQAGCQVTKSQKAPPVLVPTPIIIP
jgi:hypothetical protein